MKKILRLRSIIAFRLFAKTDYEDIWFSYVGGFDELIEHMDHYIEGEPTLEAYKDYLKSYYSLFRRIYKSALEEK